jgi:CRP/FNR family cyclic AMP-dependent transcriptional regulator
VLLGVGIRRRPCRRDVEIEADLTRRSASLARQGAPSEKRCARIVSRSQATHASGSARGFLNAWRRPKTTYSLHFRTAFSRPSIQSCSTDCSTNPSDDLVAGALLYPEEGDPRIALVIRGLLRVYLTSADGRQITVRYARDGDVLGTAVVVSGPVRTPVQAVTDTRVLLLNAEHVREIARNDCQVAWAFAEEVTRRLYDVLDELAGTALSSVRARVARHLLDLAAREAESGRWVVGATQHDIADAVGSVRELVARSLKDLRTGGLIEGHGRTIAILDPAGLHDASQM